MTFPKNSISVLIYIILVSVAAPGCIVTKKQPLTNCDHPSGWCKEIRDVAVKSWKFAQLSKNVYNKEFQFDVSSYFDKIADFENKKIDYFSSLYLEKSTGLYVFVFRGTDSPKDFATGNNPFKQKQNIYALKVYDSVRQALNIKHSVVTGHSLGGGIAIHVSLNRKESTAFSFNGSPVFRNRKNMVNERHSIVERGEVLKLTRILGREADQLYTSIGCSRGNMIKQHDMKSLAVCLTQIAAADDKTAGESLKSNRIIQ